MLIRNKESVALIGQNGCGKSTMLKILLGIDKADAGTAVLGSLSGGERSKLKLAMLMYNELNLLILDEPTNHLDIDSREELEEFLKDFKGTLFFVFHDRYFINNIASRVVELSKGSLISYNGNYEYYKDKLTQIKNTNTKVDNIGTKVSKSKNQESTKCGKSSNNKWKEIKLEADIAQLEEDLKDIENEINKFCNDYEKLNELYTKKIKFEKELEILLGEYLSC